MSTYARSLLLAASICTVAAAASAQNMSYRFSQSPQENNILSARYDYLLETNLAFRHHHMRRECRPINDASLNADCLSSFDTFEPWQGAR